MNPYHLLAFLKENCESLITKYEYRKIAQEMQRWRIQLNPEEKRLTAAEVRESGSPGRRVAEAQSGSREGGGEPEGWDEGRPNRGGHGCYSHHFSHSSLLYRIVSYRVVPSELLVNGVPSSWGGRSDDKFPGERRGFDWLCGGGEGVLLARGFWFFDWSVYYALSHVRTHLYAHFFFIPLVFGFCAIKFTIIYTRL